MKNLVLLIALVCVLNVSSCVKSPPLVKDQIISTDTLNGWERIPIVKSNISDIWFITSAKGFICSDSGIFKSIDSAKSWKQVIPAIDTFINIQFPNNLDGFVIGLKSIAKTNDGGNNWSAIQLPPQIKNGYELSFVNAAIGYITSNTGVFKTMDSAKTWQQVDRSLAYGAFFINSNVGWVGSGFNTINYTDNRGTSFTGHIAENEPAYFINFLDASNGFASCGTALLKTNNAGSAWNVIFKLYNSHTCADFHFFSTSQGYLLYGNRIKRTVDGGNVWKDEAILLPDERLVEVHVLDANNAFACG